MPPSSSIVLARHAGTVLGLSEGLDGPSNLRVAASAIDPFFTVMIMETKLSRLQYRRYVADLSALYLPSAIRTFLNNPIDAFDAVHPEFFKSFASLINVLLPSAAGYRFIREHPEETTELRAKTLSLILDWSDRKETVSHSVWTGVTRNLVQLFGNLTMADCAARDDGPQASLEPLHLSAEDRNRFKTHMRLLEGILNGCDRGAKVYFEASLGDISVVVYPGAHKSLRGSVYIDVCTEGGQYIPWWACQAKRLDRPNPEKLTPCEKGRRDELKACSKCLSVRYCSERHQKADWKEHKLTCVAPTW